MPKKRRKDIIFLQPGYAHYRDQLFGILAKRHDIHFLYESSSYLYGGEISPIGISYSFLDYGLGGRSLSLVHYFIKYRPNIIISSVSFSFRSVVSFLYAILFRKRFILWIEEWAKQTGSQQILRDLWRRCRNLIGIKLIRHCDALVVGGTASRRYALSLGKDERDIFMAIQCTDDLKLRLDKKFQQIKRRSSKYIFLYMSRIIPLKGLDILLKAFSLLEKERDDVFLLIGGHGPFAEHCQKLVRLLKISSVSFVGHLSQRSVVDVYKQADIFVLPSYFCDNQYENWGLVINEAMSMSLPIITTTAVGAAYDLVIDGYNGFVVKDNDVMALYNAMESILSLDLFQIGTNSRILFEQKNDFGQMANAFTAAIEHAKLKVHQNKECVL